MAGTRDRYGPGATSIVRPREDGGGYTRRGKGAGQVTEDPSRAAWLQQARSYLRHADPVLARLIDDRPAFDPRAWMAQLPAQATIQPAGSGEVVMRLRLRRD